jgi:hypothetical protein
MYLLALLKFLPTDTSPTLLPYPFVVKLGRETLSFWVKAFSEDTAQRLENFGFIQSRPGGIHISSTVAKLDFMT